MIKIAISGKANTGKNTVANLLINQFIQLGYVDEAIKQIAFADPIKEIISTIFPQSNHQHLYGSSKHRNNIIPNSKNVTYRQALLDIGTFMRTTYGDGIWIDLLAHEISKSSCDVVIVTDARFINEINYLKNNNFYLIRTNRSLSANINHASELLQDNMDLNLFDKMLDNNGTLQKLSGDIKAVISEILAKCRK